jgi:membrane-bound lytic murein transglycosylase B
MVRRNPGRDIEVILDGVFGMRWVQRALPAFLLVAFAVLFVAPAQADEAFAQWLKGFRANAAAQGISQKTLDAALTGLTPDPEILEAQNNQAEFVKPIWDYLGSAVSQARIRKGRAQLRRYAEQFAAIEEKYGVDRHYLAAIWGMETSYGSFMGNKSVIRSLATLAYTGDRTSFGRNQLLAALKILDNGDIDVANMEGSWAGAMGHTQFIPTTYLDYAVDFTGDGTRDIWRAISDALASTANFLTEKGWNPGETWGYEVTLPDGFNYELADGRTRRTLADWTEFGIERPSGKPFPRPSDPARLIVPAGADGPAFLLINNFYVIKRYNNATAYALAVGHLADRLMEVGPIVQSWPTDEQPLARSERKELQQLLADMGFLRGKIDGIVGPNTKAAVRAFQRSRDMVPDGFPTKRLLERMRAAQAG